MKKLFLLFAITFSFGFISCSSDGDDEKKDKDNDVICINGHCFVDLGLPSGLLWAETNLGSIYAADQGDYFAWGEISSKRYFSSDDYKYSPDDPHYFEFSKYNSNDKKTVLDKEDDAAYVKWGYSCRIPTDKDFLELIKNCTWTYTRKKNSSGKSVKGFKAVSRKNNHSIFFPTTNVCKGAVSYEDWGDCAYYWTSNCSDKSCAFCFYISYNDESKKVIPSISSQGRCDGMTIRPVAEP